MAVKQDFTKQVESQIAAWQGQIKDYQERLAQAGAQAKADYEKGLTQLKTNVDEAGKLLVQARDASEAACKRMLQRRRACRWRSCSRAGPTR